jgi:hypothetical protein
MSVAGSSLSLCSSWRLSSPSSVAVRSYSLGVSTFYLRASAQHPTQVGRLIDASQKNTKHKKPKPKTKNSLIRHGSGTAKIETQTAASAMGVFTFTP